MIFYFLRKKVILAKLLSIVFVIFAVVFTSSSLVQNKGNQLRLNLIKCSIDNFSEFPLNGIGLGCFEKHSYRSERLIRSNSNSCENIFQPDSHDWLFRILGESGILGFSGLFFFFTIFFSNLGYIHVPENKHLVPLTFFCLLFFLGSFLYKSFTNISDNSYSPALLLFFYSQVVCPM